MVTWHTADKFFESINSAPSKQKWPDGPRVFDYYTSLIIELGENSRTDYPMYIFNVCAYAYGNKDGYYDSDVCKRHVMFTCNRTLCDLTNGEMMNRQQVRDRDFLSIVEDNDSKLVIMIAVPSESQISYINIKSITLI